MNDDHQRIRDQLPRHAAGHLGPVARAALVRHLEACAGCREELALQRRIAALVAIDPLPARSPEPGLQKLMAQVRGHEQQKRLARTSSGWRQRLTAWLATPALRPVFAAAAVVAVLSGLLLTDKGPTEGYRVLSDAPATARSAGLDEVTLVFTASTSDTRREQLIAAVRGRVVAGPNSVGAYTLRLNAIDGPTALDDRLAELRRQPEVMLAEAVRPAAPAGARP